MTAADVFKTIVITFEDSFLIMSVSGNTITCKTAYSIGMESGATIAAGTWYLADFSSTAVSLFVLLMVIIINKWSGQSNLTKGHITATHGRFTGIRQVALVYLLPWAHLSPQPKRHLQLFSHFCTAHGRVSSGMPGHVIFP